MDRDDLVLDFGEMISKNDLKNPNEKLQQIQKMISKLKMDLYAETDAEARLDKIEKILRNLFGYTIVEWDLDEFDAGEMVKIMEHLTSYFAYRTMVCMPKGLDSAECFEKEDALKLLDWMKEKINGE